MPKLSRNARLYIAYQASSVLLQEVSTHSELCRAIVDDNREIFTEEVENYAPHTSYEDLSYRDTWDEIMDIYSKMLNLVTKYMEVKSEFIDD